MELDRPAGIQIQFSGQKAAIFQKLDPGKAWTKASAEGFPTAGAAQRGGQALSGVPEKSDPRHAGQPAALPKNEARVEMAYYGLIDF
jgi:hypothetical protein